MERDVRENSVLRLKLGIIAVLLGLPLLAVAVEKQADPAAPMMNKPSGDISTATADPGLCAPDGIAVGGFDLVSYRLPDGPQPGSPDFAVKHGDFTYLFATEEHLLLFASSPAAFLPAYRGWCAVTLALGRLTCPDYRNFRLEDGELLLFETTGFTNGKTLWETDVTGFRQKADDNFARLLGLQ